MQEIIKKKLLKEALKIAAIDGWNGNILERASIEAGFHPASGGVFFPGGGKELLAYFMEYMDCMMIMLYKKRAIGDMRVSERIQEALVFRFLLMQEHREAMIRAIAILAIPANITLSLKLIWRTVDLIWYEAGLDEATDFNYYTKRLLLSSIYSSATMYWIADHSNNFEETVSFIDRAMSAVHRSVSFIKKSKIASFIQR